MIFEKHTLKGDLLLVPALDYIEQNGLDDNVKNLFDMYTWDEIQSGYFQKVEGEDNDYFFISEDYYKNTFQKL